jgi:hypothetical protein
VVTVTNQKNTTEMSEIEQAKFTACKRCGYQYSAPWGQDHCGSEKFCDRRRDINTAERKLHLPVTVWKSPGLMAQMRDASAAVEAARKAAGPAPASTGKGKGKAGTDQDTRRAELDARVLSVLRTYPAGTSKRAGEIRDAMDPAPHLATLTASLKRLLKSGQAQYIEADGTYAARKAAAA